MRLGRKEVVASSLSFVRPALRGKSSSNDSFVLDFKDEVAMLVQVLGKMSYCSAGSSHQTLMRTRTRAPRSPSPFVRRQG